MLFFLILDLLNNTLKQITLLELQEEWLPFFAPFI